MSLVQPIQVEQDGAFFIPDGAPGVGIAFGLVHRVAVGEEGLVNLPDGGVAPAEQVETLAGLVIRFDGLLEVLDGNEFPLITFPKRLHTMVHPPYTRKKKVHEVSLFSPMSFTMPFCLPSWR